MPHAIFRLHMEMATAWSCRNSSHLAEMFVQFSPRCRIFLGVTGGGAKDERLCDGRRHSSRARVRGQHMGRVARATHR